MSVITFVVTVWIFVDNWRCNIKLRFVNAVLNSLKPGGDFSKFIIELGTIYTSL